MSTVVSKAVCFSKGHLIQSFVKEEALDPSSKLLVSERILICIQCGKSRDDILTEKPSVKRKPKPGNGEALDNIS